VTVTELLSGECVKNLNKAANMKKGHFYVCPVCGNVIYSVGEGVFSCCGISLPPLETEETDECHKISVEKVENDYYITLDHPMTKEHYISFFAYVTISSIYIKKLYPEQEPCVRIPMLGKGTIYAYCNRDGLLDIKV
ncbi:MAG: XRE family transcriptional regulator, partial [Bacillota bacterium]|nr:XRE family transcriptional regulator [Bacillota bacterium]